MVLMICLLAVKVNYTVLMKVELTFGMLHLIPLQLTLYYPGDTLITSSILGEQEWVLSAVDSNAGDIHTFELVTGNGTNDKHKRLLPPL
jgi:hypothetical protein